jgi:hypothetical protein
VKNTNYEAPHYAASSNLLSLHHVSLKLSPLALKIIYKHDHMLYNLNHGNFKCQEFIEEIFHVNEKNCIRMVKGFETNCALTSNRKWAITTICNNYELLNFKAKIGHIYELRYQFSKLTCFRLDYSVQIPTEAEIFSSLVWSE